MAMPEMLTIDEFPVADLVTDPVSSDPASPTHRRWTLALSRSVTALLVVGPAVALGVGIPFLWGHVIHLRDVVIGLVLYVITGHGISVGYHRLFTHRAFRANRALKIALAAAGSMAVEGSVIGWVSAHRRHHRRSDRPGDPHSPQCDDPGAAARVRAFAHAHVGWLFAAGDDSGPPSAPDLLADRDIVRISQFFSVFAVLSFALPFAAGWLLSGTLTGALTMLLWAGAVRVLLLHHVTWSINSVCHMVGSRPFQTKDHSTNFAPLAVLSFGESWHNLHHAYPESACHGVRRGQPDSSARLIQFFELVGWASLVKWPEPARLDRLAR